MKSASLIIGAGLALGLAAFVGCGSDTVETPTGGPGPTTTTSGPGGGGGAGGDMTGPGGAGGTGGQGGQGGAGGTGGGMVACEALPDACSTCLYTMCQDLYCECYGSQECVDLVFTCLSQCPAGDQQCAQDCATQYPNGVSDAALLGGCSDQNCAADCPESGIVTNECTQCLFSECETEMNACFADPECVEAVDCVQMCPANDFNCVNTCINGNQSAQTVVVCGLQSCQAQCQ